MRVNGAWVMPDWETEEKGKGVSVLYLWLLPCGLSDGENCLHPGDLRSPAGLGSGIISNPAGDLCWPTGLGPGDLRAFPGGRIEASSRNPVISVDILSQKTWRLMKNTLSSKNAFRQRWYSQANNCTEKVMVKLQFHKSKKELWFSKGDCA